MAKAKKTVKSTAKVKTATNVKSKAKSPIKNVQKKAAKKLGQHKAVVAKLEALDKMLLKLAPGPYAQVLKQIETGRRRIDEERKLALELGERILAKAKEVRDSLIRSNSKD